MPCDLRNHRPIHFDGCPDRMSREDQEIWAAWWPTVREHALNLWFDVGLGAGAHCPDDVADNLRSMWLRNTQKRADAVIETPREVWIVELRFAAQSSALGRLLVYLMLWRNDPPIAKPARGILVTNFNDPETRVCCQDHRIDFVVV